MTFTSHVIDAPGSGGQSLNELPVRKICVLLADDNRRMLQHVSEFQSADGCEVVATLSDGQAALDAAMKLRPDVVVLDISMPILNGIEAATRLRQTDSGAQIVFLTVYDDPETCHAAFETGALGYVLKARLRDDLIPAIQRARVGRRFVSPGLLAEARRTIVSVQCGHTP